MLRLRKKYKRKLNKFFKTLIIIIVLFIINFNVATSTDMLVEEYHLVKTVDVTAVAMKDKEEKPKPKPIVVTPVESNRYSGVLTGYSADCPLCGGTLACKSGYNVYKNGVITYPDQAYGSVRIVASSKSMPCGSIVRFNLSGSTITAIVLDRGVVGRNLDLLTATENDARVYVGRKNISYDVLRRGW